MAGVPIEEGNSVAHVLIVDDRALNRDLLRTVLRYHGHETLEASGGAEALDLLRQRGADVVVADVLMPGMDGYELARMIRSDRSLRHIPVVFFTANYVEDEIRPIAHAVGVERIVTKTGDMSEIVQAVDEALVARAPAPPNGMPAEEFGREHLRLLNSKLLQKVTELEEGARLHQMVEAIVAVGDDPGWSALMSRIADAACSLVDAEHVSLMTTPGDGRVGSTVHAGRPDPLAEHDPNAYAVAIRVGDDVVGHLLATPRQGKRFTARERHALETLGRAAGVAIANAQLYDDARRRQEWLAASADVTTTLLGADPAEAGRLIANGARRVVGADVAWIGRAEQPGAVTITAADGEWGSLLRNRMIDASEAVVFADVSASAHPVVITDASRDDRTRRAAATLRLPVGPLLAVPLRASSQTFGVLFLGKRRGGPAFTALDVEMARAFANRAALTLEFARAAEHRQRLNLAEDRNRIARDLHDVVIQRLFGMGLRLERLRGLVTDEVAEEISGVTDDLDRTIDDIRTTIFSLQNTDPGDSSLRAELLKVVESASFLLTFAPRLRIEGPIDRAVPEHVQAHLLATVSEALSNAVRHAAASHVDVVITVADGELVLRVQDDGRGLPPQRRERGLENLRRRADDLGGTMTLGSGPNDRGTELCWRVPLDDGGQARERDSLRSWADAAKLS